MKWVLSFLAALMIPVGAGAQDEGALNDGPDAKDPPSSDKSVETLPPGTIAKRGPVKEGPVWSDDFKKTVVRLPPEKEIEVVTKVEAVNGLTPPAPIPCDRVGKKIEKMVTGELATLEGALLLAKYDDGILFRVEKVALCSWSGFGFLDFPVFINYDDLPKDIQKAVGGFDPEKAQIAHVHRFVTCEDAGVCGFPGIYGPNGEKVLVPWKLNGQSNPLVDPFLPGNDTARAMTYDELQRWLAELRKRKEAQGANLQDPKRSKSDEKPGHPSQIRTSDRNGKNRLK